ncbi:alpha/beta hydrolase [Niabella ginsengisoli]|uniref:Alpha/beta hydrolase n=1 Tax=Niabella ginsengisoli TaxID=522298 RepID=A0ABS9SQ08_9BACT|nr:alpha/beta hydrolase [Niabella ginsengisoli]MCH5600457.1 alpha/beta hydrolase [Niabella ginsengisoli]
MSKIYIFSGLGVDRRVFQNIDFGELDIEHVEWIKPIKDEPLQNYARRISSNINTKDPILIGLSFGGMLAVEISKIINTKKIILIASAKNKNELPKNYFIGWMVKLMRFLPSAFLTKPNFIAYRYFGVKQPPEKQLLKEILRDTDPGFFNWAMQEIINWTNEITPPSCIHIHGNKDRIIPIENVKADYVINNGGHFMTVNKAKEIELIIKKHCT